MLSIWAQWFLEILFSKKLNLESLDNAETSLCCQQVWTIGLQGHKCYLCLGIGKYWWQWCCWCLHQDTHQKHCWFELRGASLNQRSFPILNWNLNMHFQVLLASLLPLPVDRNRYPLLIVSFGPCIPMHQN